MRFDLDPARAAICLFGCFCLLAELIGFYATRETPPDYLTVIFGGLAVAPFGDKFREQRRRLKRERGDDDDDPEPRDGRHELEDLEEDFHDRHGYYEMRLA